MIRVFIIDDHKMVIEGIQLLIDGVKNIKVIGTALRGNEGIEKLKKTPSDVVLLDINMPDLNGIETCKILLNKYPDIKIIAISMHKEGSLIKMILGCGAKGYILKSAGRDEIIKAIETVYNGNMYLGETVNRIIINSVTGNSTKSNSPFPTLSRREKEVLQLILKEYTTQEIAEKLFISFGTVETHRRNMLIKLGARNTAGLVKIAMEYELYK